MGGIDIGGESSDLDMIDTTPINSPSVNSAAKKGKASKRRTTTNSSFDLSGNEKLLDEEDMKSSESEEHQIEKSPEYLPKPKPSFNMMNDF